MDLSVRGSAPRSGGKIRTGAEQLGVDFVSPPGAGGLDARLAPRNRRSGKERPPSIREQPCSIFGTRTLVTNPNRLVMGRYNSQPAAGDNDMNNEIHQKVQASHLKRDAYLYVRQSTIRQVFENTESTKRQYALRQRAAALGWTAKRIIVIDSDQGRSGEAMTDREGFQKLVAEVGMGRVGIVLGLEVSRLARNCADWHRLLELCALTDTLILDEDGLYDPHDFNDRLLLGLK